LFASAVRRFAHALDDANLLLVGMSVDGEREWRRRAGHDVETEAREFARELLASSGLQTWRIDAAASTTSWSRAAEQILDRFAPFSVRRARSPATPAHTRVRIGQGRAHRREAAAPPVR